MEGSGMRMSRTLSVTRAPIRHRKGALDESGELGGSMAHAPASVPRSGNLPVRLTLDAAACNKGLLGHGASAWRGPGISPYVQRRAGAWHSSRENIHLPT